MGATRGLENLRARIAATPRNNQGRRQYSQGLRDRVRRYARDRLRAGAGSLKAVARELAISNDTLWSWVNGGKAAKSTGVGAGGKANAPPAGPRKVRAARPAPARGEPERDRASMFRAAVAELGPRRQRTPYPVTLRTAAIAYMKERQSTGEGLAAIARDLGVGADSLRVWSGMRRRGVKAVRRVAVKEPGTAVVGGGIVIAHGATGLRIEGMDVAGLVALVRSLS